MKLSELLLETQDDENLKLVQQNGFNIKGIQNPSKEVQVAAVTQNPYAILQIANPDKEAIDAAYENADDDLKIVIKSRFQSTPKPKPVVSAEAKHPITYDIWVINRTLDDDGLEFSVSANNWEEAKKKALKLYMEDFENDTDLDGEEFGIEDFKGTIFELINIDDISKDNVNQFLTDISLIRGGARAFNYYQDFVKDYFKDNALLMNKWLRYADNIKNG